MKELSVENQIYLCKYWDIDKSLYTTIGLKEDEVKETLERLKENGLYEQYRSLPEEEYEKIVKKEKDNKKHISFAEKILNKYKFDKSSLTCDDITKVLNEYEKHKNEEGLNLTEVFRRIAKERKVEPYVINNNCKRALEKAYSNNKEIFNAEYEKKPTLKEFFNKELGLENKNVICNITENEKDVCESKETISLQFKSEIEDIDNTFVKVSVKKMMEWSYYKGYLDGILRKTNNEG